MSKYYNIDYADQDLTFIIQKSGYGRYVENLEKRIDKAIKYIEKTKCNDLNEGKISKNTVYINELLDILKGSDKE